MTERLTDQDWTDALMVEEGDPREFPGIPPEPGEDDGGWGALYRSLYDDPSTPGYWWARYYYFMAKHLRYSSPRVASRIMAAAYRESSEEDPEQIFLTWLWGRMNRA